MLLRHTLLYLPAQVLGPLMQFVAIFAWAWWLSPRDMGAFTIIAATQELGYLLFLSWFSAYALRFHRRDSDDDADAYRAAETVVLAAAGALNFLLALVTVTLVLDEPPGAEMVMAAGLFMSARSLGAHMAERARAAERIAAYTILQVSGPALGLLLGLALRPLVTLDAAWALALYALGHGLSIAVAAPMIGMRARPPREAAPVLGKALAYGLPLLLAGGFSWVALNAVRYVTESFEGLAAAGLIAVGLGLGQRGAAFAAMFVTAAAFPLAVKAQRESGEAAAMRQLMLGGALLIAALAPAAAGLLAINGDISRLLVKESYAAITLAVLPWAVVMGVARNLRSHFPDQVFLLAARPRVVTLIDAVDGGLTLLGAIAGIMMRGAPGAVAGAAMGAIAAAAFSFALAAREKHFAFPWSHALRAIAASLLMLAALLVMPAAAGIWQLLLKVVLAAAIYAVALAALYPAEIRKAIKSPGMILSGKPE